MNKETLNIAEITDLDDLFSQARAEQPMLSEPNFTKVVVNQLPQNLSRRGVLLAKRRGWSFDILGMLVGLLAVALLVEPVHLFSSMLNVVPESFSLSAMTLISVAFGGLGLSLGAWWMVEKKL